MKNTIKNFRRAFFCTLALLSGMVSAQTITNRNEFVVAGGSGDYAPFWHFSNRNGVNSYKPNSSFLRVAVEGEHPLKHDFSLRWGVDAVSGWNVTAPVFVQQAYFDASWKQLVLSVGQQERFCIMKNPRLSTGDRARQGCFAIEPLYQALLISFQSLERSISDALRKHTMVPRPYGENAPYDLGQFKKRTPNSIENLAKIYSFLW